MLEAKFHHCFYFIIYFSYICIFIDKFMTYIDKESKSKINKISRETLIVYNFFYEFLLYEILMLLKPCNHGQVITPNTI